MVREAGTQLHVANRAPLAKGSCSPTTFALQTQELKRLRRYCSTLIVEGRLCGFRTALRFISAT